jgi:hypothetical protein
LVIKNNSISSFLKGPTSRDKNLSKNVASKVRSGLNNHVPRLKVKVPVYVDGIPAVITEWAFEEQMKAYFFRSIGKKYTRIVIKEHVFSFQNIPGAKPIPDQQPSKKFMLTKISRFPNPRK